MTPDHRANRLSNDGRPASFPGQSAATVGLISCALLYGDSAEQIFYRNVFLQPDTLQFAPLDLACQARLRSQEARPFTRGRASFWQRMLRRVPCREINISSCYTRGSGRSRTTAVTRTLMRPNKMPLTLLSMPPRRLMTMGGCHKCWPRVRRWSSVRNGPTVRTPIHRRARRHIECYCRVISLRPNRASRSTDTNLYVCYATALSQWGKNGRIAQDLLPTLIP